MFNLLKDQLLDDAASRAEQSRVSYNLQTEEFRSLNTNLQTYLDDIKIIDENNRQLQENIDQIRTNYILTLENHLKRLPNDFREQSHTLTDAHLERYRSKSRARRFINEREELKKRINFLAYNEKEQVKRLNNLQKQERSTHNEFIKLNEQIQKLITYVETEKQTHRQAMDKVDSLQVQLERVCVERSKTEFEIQTLREEVKLMQTAKEFLDEEHQTILSTQTEANEYLLSRLNESILRIREDFDELNKSQLKQFENEYKQMMQTIEEKTLTNATVDEAILNQQRTIQMENEQMQDEHRSMTQELTTLNDHNHILSERILTMEADLYSIRDDRMRELNIKDNELEQSKIELQTLNEKLNHLAEYDRNLKFELTLYRGVLESEYRRKQQQLISNQQLARPTTLRANKNSMISTSRNQGEKMNDQLDKNKTRSDEKNKDESNRQESLLKESTEQFNQDQQEKSETKNITSKEENQTPIEVQQESTITSSGEETLLSESQKSPSATISLVPNDQSPVSDARQAPVIPVRDQSKLKSSPTNQETSSNSSAPSTVLPNLAEQDQRQPPPTPPQEDRQILSEVQQSPSSSTTVSILPKEQPPSLEAHQSPNTPSEARRLSMSLSTDEETSLTSAAPISSEIPQSSSASVEDRQTPSADLESSDLSTTPAATDDQTVSSEVQQSPSTPQEDRQIPSEAQQSSLSSTVPITWNEQLLSSEGQQSSNTPSDFRTLSTNPSADEDTSANNAAPISSGISQSSSASVEDRQTPSEDLKSSHLSTTPATTDDQTASSEVQQSPSTPQEDRQIPPEAQQSSLSSTVPIIWNEQLLSSEGQQSSNTPLDFRTLSTNPSADEDTSTNNAAPISSEIPHPSSVSVEDRQTPSEDPESSDLSTTPAATDDQTASSELQQSPSTAQEDHQIPSEAQQSPSSSTVPIIWNEQLLSSEGQQSSNTSSDVRTLSTNPSTDEDTSDKNAAPISSEIPQSFSASLEDPQTLSKDLKSSASSTTLTAQEDQTTSSEIQQSPSTPEEDRQISSEIRTLLTNPSADDEKTVDSTALSTSADDEKTVDSTALSTSADDEKTVDSTALSTSEIPPSSSASLEDRQSPTHVQKLPSISPSTSPRETSSETLKSPTTSTAFEDQAAELRQSPTILEEVQLQPKDLPANEQTPSDIQKSPSSSTDVVAPADLSTSSEVRQSSSSASENRQSTASPSAEYQSISSDIQHTMATFSPEQPISSELQQSLSIDEVVQEQPSSIAADEYQTTTPMSYSSDDKSSPTAGEAGEKSYVTQSTDRRNSDVKESEKIKSPTQDTDELSNSENVNNERHQSTSYIDQSTLEEYDNIPSDKRESSTLETTSPSQEETKQNGHSSSSNELSLKQEETSEQILNEEDMTSSSSYENKTEEDSKISYISSSGYDDNVSDSTLFTHQESNKISSSKTSLTDVEIDNTDLIGEAGSSASPKIDEKEFDDNNESSLETAMQDLRYVYRTLSNDDNLVEINDEFPDNLIDRLEFGDNLIETVFDALLTKYIVQAAKDGTRSKTVDWIEFRDILFPIITGRYMERHIRKLFHLFDTTKDSYLSVQEIIELFELLQVNNTNALAQSMINDFDTNLDGKLSVDELIEAIKKADDTNKNILSDEIELKQWYIQHPTDEENNDNQSISLDVPNVNISSRNDETIKIFNDEIALLGRIFKRVGADVKNKQLDSNKATLTMKITNDFVNNNIHISNVDLQSFIELYLTKKQTSDCFINWIEFRDIFLPIVNGGMLSKEDITRWFDILDTNQNGIIIREQILHLLRLLQIPNSEEVVNKMNEISGKFTNDMNSWTLDELLFALENIDETACHLISNHEHIISFDLNWLHKNIF